MLGALNRGRLLITAAGLAAAVFHLPALAAASPDLNKDGIVNVQDLGILLTNWCTSACTTSKLTAANLNGDVFVNVQDLGVLLANWNKTITPPPPPPATGTTGIPFAPYGPLPNGAVPPSPFTASHVSQGPGWIINNINDARNARTKVILALPCGAHNVDRPGLCLSSSTGVLAFDMNLFKKAMDSYSTAAIKDAVAKGVADGTIIGINIMDEPYVKGLGDGNTWGPAGTMTKAKVDAMCAYAKNVFPTAKIGVAHQHHLFEPDKSYAVCEFVIDQYGYRFGSIASYRDAGLAMGQRDYHGILFSFNPVNEGTQDRDGTWDCKDQGGIKGQREPLCAMTAAQIRESVNILGPATCEALAFWRYDNELNANVSISQAYRDAAAQLSKLPLKPCRRW